MPPRESSRSMNTLSTSAGESPPRETYRPPVRQQEEGPRVRIRGKSQPANPIPRSPIDPCPASQSPSQDSQSSEGRPEPYGCWDVIYEVLRKPVLVDRHIPRELKALWQKVMLQLLTADQSRTDVYPVASESRLHTTQTIAFESPGEGGESQRPTAPDSAHPSKSLPGRLERPH